MNYSYTFVAIFHVMSRLRKNTSFSLVKCEIASQWFYRPLLEKAVLPKHTLLKKKPRCIYTYTNITEAKKGYSFHLRKSDHIPRTHMEIPNNLYFPTDQDRLLLATLLTKRWTDGDEILSRS